MKAFFKHFSFIIIYLALTQLIPVIVLLLYPQKLNYVSYALAFSALICASLGYFMYRSELIPLFQRFKANWKLPLFFIVSIWLIACLLMAILSVSLGVKQTANQANLEAIVKYMPTYLLILTVAFTVPFVEEIIFRHILITKLGHIIPIPLATIISIALFAAAHAGNDIKALFIYLPLTLGLTGAYFLTKGRMIGSLILHIINNGVSAIIMICFTS